MTDEIKSLLHSVMGEITLEQLQYFSVYTPLIEALESELYKRVRRTEIHDIDQDSLREVDRYLIGARHYHSLNDKLFKKLLQHAIEMAVLAKDYSLCETLIIVLDHEASKYPRLVDLALEFAISDKQMRRVLFNCVRESMPEVRKYSVEAEGFYSAGDVFPWIPPNAKESSQTIFRRLKSN